MLFVSGRQIFGYPPAFGYRTALTRISPCHLFFVALFDAFTSAFWYVSQRVLLIALVFASWRARLLAWPWAEQNPGVLMLLSASLDDPCGRC